MHLKGWRRAGVIEAGWGELIRQRSGGRRGGKDGVRAIIGLSGGIVENG